MKNCSTKQKIPHTKKVASLENDHEFKKCARIKICSRSWEFFTSLIFFRELNVTIFAIVYETQKCSRNFNSVHEFENIHKLEKIFMKLRIVDGLIKCS